VVSPGKSQKLPPSESSLFYNYCIEKGLHFLSSARLKAAGEVRESMSEVVTNPSKDVAPAELPLSVSLFHAAMKQEVALSEFAKSLGIGALSLRQFIAGQTQRPRGRTLELLAKELSVTVDEVRQRTTLRPLAAPRFDEWLEAKMKEKHFSRAKLTRETHISDGALRNYLSGQTLPDSDQSQRLAEVLEVEPLELAKVLVADHTVRSGGQTLSPTAGSGDSDPNAIATGLGNRSDDARLLNAANQGNDEERLLSHWNKLHPQGRRATLIYIAALLAEG